MNAFQRQLANLRQQQQLLYILVFSFATILIWLALSLFTSQKKTEISKELQELAKPLSPTINRTILEQLQQERVFTEAELADFPIYKILVSEEGAERMVTIDTDEDVTPSPSPRPSPASTPVPVISIEATPSATPATGSGAL